MKKFICLLGIGLVLFVGCIKEFNANLPYTDQDLLVVEGDIVANSDVVFILSKTFSLSEDKLPDGYNDIKATLYVAGSDGYRSESGVEVGKGRYKVAIGNLKENAEYWLVIEYGGETYQSVPESPLFTSPIDSISFSQVGLGDIELRLTTHDMTSEKQYYIWTFEEDWEIEMPFYVTYFYNPESGKFYNLPDDPYFYCWQHEVSSSVLISSTEALVDNKIYNEKFHSVSPYSDKVQSLYCISVHQRSISRKAYLYYQNKKKYSEEMGGLFTPQPSDLPSNIVCVTNGVKKAIGYVGVSLNTAFYRKFISKHELSLPSISGCGVPEFPGNMSDDAKYRQGYRPIYYDFIEGVIWRSKECTDCRTKGTKNKPDFWPNDHQ